MQDISNVVDRIHEGNQIKTVNQLSSELNAINKETYLLDTDNLDHMTLQEKEISNKLFDVLNWSKVDYNNLFNITKRCKRCPVTW